MIQELDVPDSVSLARDWDRCLKNELIPHPDSVAGPYKGDWSSAAYPALIKYTLRVYLVPEKHPYAGICIIFDVFASKSLTKP